MAFPGMLVLSGAALLSASNASADPSSWGIDNNGLWSTPQNWSPAHVPLPPDDVTIDRPAAAAYTVTLSSGAQSINSLSLKENHTVSGGSLSIASTAQIGGTLKLSSNSQAGGTLKGGTWTTTAGGSITVAGMLATLDGVNLGADVTIPNATTLNVINGLTLSGNTLTLSSTGGSTALNFTGAQTLGGNGAIVFGGSSSLENINATGLTIGPNVALRTGTQGATVYLGSASTNKGLISAQTPGQTLLVYGNNWVNNGALSVSAGTLTMSGTWSNPGTINVSGGTLNLGGAFSDIGQLTRTGTTSSVNIAGVLDRAGGSITLDHTTGSWGLNGGSIRNAKISFTDGANLVPVPFSVSTTSELDNTTLSGDWTLPADGHVTVQSGMTLDHNRIFLNSGAQMSFQHYLTGSQTLGGTGEIVFQGTTVPGRLSVQEFGANTLTIGPGVKVHGGNGQFYIDNGMFNRGTIDADIAGTSILFSGADWRNDGTLMASAGTIKTSFPFYSTGTLAISGKGKLDLGRVSIVDGSHIRADLDSLDPAATVGPISATSYTFFPGQQFLDLTGGVPGSTYTVLTGLQYRTGQFTDVTPGYDVTYEENSIRVTLMPWLIADINHDGRVSVGDLGILATHFGETTTGGRAVGDCNLDGKVTVGDLGLLATYFGQASPAGLTLNEAMKAFPNLQAAAVPEPAGAIVLLVLIPSTLRRR